MEAELAQLGEAVLSADLNNVLALVALVFVFAVASAMTGGVFILYRVLMALITALETLRRNADALNENNERMNDLVERVRDTSQAVRETKHSVITAIASQTDDMNANQMALLSQMTAIQRGVDPLAQLVAQGNEDILTAFKPMAETIAKLGEDAAAINMAIEAHNIQDRSMWSTIQAKQTELLVGLGRVGNTLDDIFQRVIEAKKQNRIGENDGNSDSDRVGSVVGSDSGDVVDLS